jgi:hypothetical protein
VEPHAARTLHDRFERLLVIATYFSAWVLHPVQVLFQDTTRIGLPENPLLVEANGALSMTLSRSRYWLALVLLGALAVILVRRWVGAPRPQRQALGPVLATRAPGYELELAPEQIDGREVDAPTPLPQLLGEHAGVSVLRIAGTEARRGGIPEHGEAKRRPVARTERPAQIERKDRS